MPNTLGGVGMNIVIDRSTYNWQKSFDYANLVNAVYDLHDNPGNTFSGYTLRKPKVDSASGFKAGLYKNDDTGQWVIAIAGTDSLLGWGDMIADGDIFFCSK
jgi:hypothetical protein